MKVLYHFVAQFDEYNWQMCQNEEHFLGTAGENFRLLTSYSVYFYIQVPLWKRMGLEAMKCQSRAAGDLKKLY